MHTPIPKSSQGTNLLLREGNDSNEVEVEKAAPEFSFLDLSLSLSRDTCLQKLELSSVSLRT